MRGESPENRIFLAKLLQRQRMQSVYISTFAPLLLLLLLSCFESCPTLRPQRRQSTRLPCPWDSLGKNTGVGCHFLLQSVKVKSLSRVRLLTTPWTAAYQAPPSMGFSRQEYWSGLPFPSPGDLPDPGIEPGSPAFQADALTAEPPGKNRI